MEPAPDPRRFHQLLIASYCSGILSKTVTSTREESPRFSLQNGIWDEALAMRTVKSFLRDETAATAIEQRASRSPSLQS
jgi:hypothetical protein